MVKEMLVARCSAVCYKKLFEVKKPQDLVFEAKKKNEAGDSNRQTYLERPPFTTGPSLFTTI